MTALRNASTRGTIYCALSSVAYTLYNVCLRDVSEKHDPAWINSMQASVGTTVLGAYLLYQAARGRRPLPPWRELLALLVVGLITQVGGVLFVWALPIVGVAVTATLQTGVMLAASAILGLIVLGERVTGQQAIAIALITVAVVFFSSGAESVGDAAALQAVPDGVVVVAGDGAAAPVQPPAVTPLLLMLGIGASILAGLAFAVLTVGVRKTVTSQTSPEAVVFLINMMGVVVFGPWCVYRFGLATLLETPPQHLGLMLGAGAMNVIGFLLVTLSLKLITVVRVNVISNALTAALTVAAGIAVFREPWNRNVVLGIALSLVGVLLISLVAPPEEQTSAAPS